MPEKLYSLDLVKKLAHNNKEVVHKLINVFMEQAPASLRDIRSAYYSKDYAAVSTLAHKIKPTYGYFSIHGTEKDLELIEKLSVIDSPSPEIEEIIIKLEQATRMVVAEMKADLN